MKFVIGDLDNVNKHCNEKNGEHFNTPHIEYWTFDESNDSDRDGTHFVSFDDSGINCIIFSFFSQLFCLRTKWFGFYAYSYLIHTICTISFYYDPNQS